MTAGRDKQKRICPQALGLWAYLALESIGKDDQIGGGEEQLVFAVGQSLQLGVGGGGVEDLQLHTGLGVDGGGGVGSVIHMVALGEPVHIKWVIALFGQRVQGRADGSLPCQVKFSITEGVDLSTDGAGKSFVCAKKWFVCVK